QAEDGIRDGHVTGVQTCALPICPGSGAGSAARASAREPRQLVRALSGRVREFPRGGGRAGVAAGSGGGPSLRGTAGHTAGAAVEIGRASCRERGGIWVGGGGVEE